MNIMLTISAVILGFTAMSSQIIFVRELLVAFYGNELSIGFILASWLFGGGIGSIFLGRFSDRIKHRAGVLALLFFIIGVAIPVDVLIIRLLKSTIGIGPGEIVPLSIIAASCLVVLVPTCAILGFIFSLICGMYRSKNIGPAGSIGRIYVLESAGSIAGGITASFVFLSLFDPVYIAAAIGVINVAAPLIVLSRSKNGRSGRMLALFSAVISVLWILSWPLGYWQKTASWSLEKRWAGYDIAASGNSIYGNVVLTRNLGQYSFFDNGLRLYTVPERQNAEEAIHYPLLEHPDPKNILLVGGGAGGLLAEILKYPIEKCDYVELDPLIIKTAKDFLPAKYIWPLDDPKISTINTDGRHFIKTSGRKYDCVIINVGAPFTAQIDRYYTVEFFRETKRILNKGGVVSFGLNSSENYINHDLAAFLRSIHTTLSKVFRYVTVIPGETAYFIASNDNILTRDYNVLEERARNRRLDILYVREYYLASKLSPLKIRYIDDIVDKAGMINYDFRPISYYLETIFWSAHFRGSIVTWALRQASSGRIIFLIFFVCASVAVYAAFSKGKAGGFENLVLLTVMSSGFSGLAIQVAVLFAFQVIYGYLFYKLGIILTAFMVGLAVGSRLAIKFTQNLKSSKSLFIRSHAIFSFLIFLLPPALNVLARGLSRPFLWFGSNIAFPAISIAAGAITGFQFPLAVAIYLARSAGRPGAAAGVNYGINLAGACLGAFLSGAVFIPVIGLNGTCFAAGCVSLSCLLGSIFLSRD